MMNSNTLQITTQVVGDASLLWDVLTGVFRPLVPIKYREAVFQSLLLCHSRNFPLLELCSICLREGLGRSKPATNP
jgi:hypothetical protein